MSTLQHLTLWPEVPLGPPAPARDEPALLPGGFLRWTNWDEDAMRVPTRRAPADQIVFFELWDLDLAGAVDPGTSAVNFATEHGAVWLRHPAVDRALPNDQSELVAARLRGRDEAGIRVNHVLDVHRWLQEAKCLTAHAVALMENRSAVGAWEFDPEVTDEATARRRFVDSLNAGLTMCAPHVSDPSEEAKVVEGQTSPDLYAAMCVMVHDALVGGRELRRCEYVKCERPFLYQRVAPSQRERARRAKGVKYCSPRCANNQGQRNIRERRANA